MEVADPRDARGCLPSISSRKASTEPKPLTPFLRGGRGYHRFPLRPDVASPQPDPLRRLQTAVKRLKVFFGAPAFILSLAALSAFPLPDNAAFALAPFQRCARAPVVRP